MINFKGVQYPKEAISYAFSSTWNSGGCLSRIWNDYEMVSYMAADMFNDRVLTFYAESSYAESRINSDIDSS